MPAGEWNEQDHVRRYLERADEFPRRAEGESVLLGRVPSDVSRVLDLGTGDGRLLALLRRDRPHLRGVGLDVSDVMLEAARERSMARSASIWSSTTWPNRCRVWGASTRSFRRWPSIT
jgi:trans-aconitate methyltransferase